MKKLRFILSILLCLVISVGCAATVCADDNTYKLKDLNMSIKFSETMSVKTKDNSPLADEVYLEATSSDSELSIIITMIENETTKEVFSFKDRSPDTLEAYKEDMLEKDIYIDCSTGVYGKVPFLDFALKPTAENGTDVYCMQSVTVVNGKNITITSRSVGDSFTSDELATIKHSLDTIKFTRIKSLHAKANFAKVIIWIVVILFLLAVGFVVLSYYMSKRSAERQRQLKRERERRRKSEYDAISDTDKEDTEIRKRVSGYRTSRDYFESGYDDYDPTGVYSSRRRRTEEVSDTEPTAMDTVKAVTDKAVKSTSEAFTHMGYFFRNLKKETAKHSKKSSRSKHRASAHRSTRSSYDRRYTSQHSTSRRTNTARANDDYDIFSER